jgi:hypothetical protein
MNSYKLVCLLSPEVEPYDIGLINKLMILRYPMDTTSITMEDVEGDGSSCRPNIPHRSCLKKNPQRKGCQMPNILPPLKTT